MELEPPLELNVLQHIASFHSALVITAPMTDAAWEMLRPRLLAQREAAEYLEHQRAEKLAVLQATQPTSASDEPYTRPAKEVYDKEYEHAQEPLRKKLSEYAEDFINGPWNGARALDKDNAPIFAVQTMLNIHQRYLADKEAGLLDFPAVPAKAGSKQGTPIPEPFLSLDNMKWVYDNKIRPLSDSHRRELFICAGCSEERKPKWFAFEGLIQHYGAKHTTAFTKGNIVVHWQTSEWPDDPPFHPNPSNWIKPDRRMSDNRAHGRARGTPQARHDGPFPAPGSGKLLSESPFFSNHNQQSPQAANGYYSATPGHQTYPAYQNGHSSPQTVPYGYNYPAAALTQPSVDMSYDAQLNKLSGDAREIWDGLDGVKDLLESVRVQTVLHLVVMRFAERFRQKPNLDMITDALASNPLVQPIKNARGLACKICVASQTDGSASYQSYYARIREAERLFNVSSLITHFKLNHQPQENICYPDWTTDMIELPETQMISNLKRAPGMDDGKLAIVAAAFPTAFPSPLPKIGLVQEPPPDVGPDSGLASRLLDRMAKKSKQHPKKKGHHGANGTSARDESQEPLAEPKEDEYDPRRPMFLETEGQTTDPARFDTDVARKASASTSPMSAGTLNLAPETLAALNNLNALTSQGQQPQMIDRPDRSPSVGRAEPPSSVPKPLESASNAAPDISAILASLTGQSQQAQTATPPTTVSRSGSVPRHPHPDTRGPAPGVSPRIYQDDKFPSSRYARQASYRGSAEPAARYDGQDLQSAISRNARHFEQNRGQPYVEPPYAHQQHSPPRFRYVYDEAHTFSHPAQQAPVYHEAPIQYIQIPPEHERQPPVYQYERPAPKPMYVDEHGRPLQLIPIDSAPAPIQYAPHPLELQQQQYSQHAPAVSYATQGHPQPVYDDRRAAVYYEPVGHGYDDGARSSVPRG